MIRLFPKPGRYLGFEYRSKIEDFYDRFIVSHYAVNRDGRTRIPFSKWEEMWPESFKTWVDIRLIHPNDLGLDYYSNHSLGEIRRIRTDHGVLTETGLRVWVKLEGTFDHK